MVTAPESTDGVDPEIRCSRGWPCYYDRDTGLWRYVDTNEAIGDDRACRRCGEPPTPEGHDACLGHLEGVRACCCGHGVSEPYTIEW